MPRARLTNVLFLSIGIGILMVCLSLQQFKVAKQVEVIKGEDDPNGGRMRRALESSYSVESNPAISSFTNKSENDEPYNYFVDASKSNDESLHFDDNTQDELQETNQSPKFLINHSPKVSVLTSSSDKGDSFDAEKLLKWNPLISLHAVKHMFGIHLPRSFLREKLTNYSKTFDNKKVKKKLKGSEKEKNDICPSYYNDTTIEKTVFPRLYGKCDTGYQNDDVTLLIQMDNSHGYFDKLYNISNYWSGPISVALFINSSGTTFKFSDLTEENLRREIKNVFYKYKLQNSTICVHIVKSEEGLSFYPVNTLRNVAIKYAQTDLVFLIEADFIPMPGLAKVFTRPLLKHNLLYKKLAYVVPSFSMQIADHGIPQNKKQLLKQWQSNVTIPIHYSKNFKGGHKPTDYKRYGYSNKIYKVKFTSSYEPYYVVHRKRTPYYPEEFLHGFRDKSIHAYILNYIGFEFHVLPNTYIVHTPHMSSYERNDNLYDCALIAFEDFSEQFKDLTNNTMLYK